jgi:hypothetical protein
MSSTGLDLAGRLAEYVAMEAPIEAIPGEQGPVRAPRPSWQRRALWAIVLLALATVTALAFTAYRQPELLLNLLGLRYCG